MPVRDIAVIAASLGGVEALSELVRSLDTAHAGIILIVQHSAAHGPRLLDQLLQRQTSLPVKYGDRGERIRQGSIYLAPPGAHLVVSRHESLVLDYGPKIRHVRPAADPLFESVSRCFASRVAGVVLTGCDSDGTQGLRAVKSAGGICIVQHPAHARAPEMPMNALNGDSPDYCLSASEIGRLLSQLARTNSESGSANSLHQIDSSDS